MNMFHITRLVDFSLQKRILIITKLLRNKPSPFTSLNNIMQCKTPVFIIETIRINRTIKTFKSRKCLKLKLHTILRHQKAQIL